MRQESLTTNTGVNKAQPLFSVSSLHDSNHFKEGFEKQCFKYFYGQLLPCSGVFMLLGIASATEANCEISNLFIPWYIHTHLQQ